VHEELTAHMLGAHAAEKLLQNWVRLLLGLLTGAGAGCLGA
jgi:hypothetical protein